MVQRLKSSKKLNHACGGGQYLCLAFESCQILILNRLTCQVIKKIRTQVPILTVVFNSEDKEFIGASLSTAVYLKERHDFRPHETQLLMNFRTALFQSIQNEKATLVGSYDELLQCVYFEHQKKCSTLKVRDNRDGFYITGPDGQEKTVKLNGLCRQ